MSDIRFHEMGDGRKVAFRHTSGNGPTLVFLPGYMSDMAGGKASAIFDAAVAKGRSCLLLDYTGCGESSGDFADGTLSRWREEVMALIDAYVEGPVLLVGSSMGGWLMLLVGEALHKRLAGIIGIASAPDFTVWGFSEDKRDRLLAGEVVLEDNPYGPEPTPTHPGFYADAQDNLRLYEEVKVDAPVRLLHGQRDDDVPWAISIKLAAALRSDDVQVTLIKDGDHRLSREADIAQLLAVVDSFY
ncbi:alpha/beta hydrolase [Erythrobacter sp. SCSIO 43205]|uniref:alpha/beta fold hydrolase n=1 Tax=Erythrobacter sp. SCSIO 43205 TaxID=2779361 RepID=UPI001CA89FAE|nr:alpha/beta hydrolase [Erythrobacter sp. SCSIO 43205]UAB78561.1 alpha/beta hydrolase [Erythrobacter sp. SCSIO 43205]